ncbi:ABC transporter permease [Arthrobacter sp. Sr24]
MSSIPTSDKPPTSGNDTVAITVAPDSRSASPNRLRAALSPLRIIAAIFVLLIVLATIMADWLGLADPAEQNIVNKLLPIGSPEHPLGTDQFGRDLLSRLIFGARIELVVALGATSIAVVLGTFLGLVGGFYGRWVETITMRSVDVILAFPPIILALLIVTIYGPGILTLIVVMGLLFAPAYARLTYGQVMTVRHSEYVEASQVFGATKWRTLLSVVLPNVAAPIIVQLPLTLASAILLESGLSFLGLGVVPPTPSWGLMVADGQRFMMEHPEQILLPSIIIALTILAFGLLGDVLRDWLDPRRAIARNY